MEEKNEVIKYFLKNIFEAKSAYEAWKMIFAAKSHNIVNQIMAERYVKIQNYHSKFFVLTQHAFLVMFTVLVCHVFDKRSDSFSLDKADDEEYKIFYNNNNIIIEKLKIIRHKIFAHRDIEVDPNEISIPSIDDLDKFFKNLEELYNKISLKINNSMAIFNAISLRDDIEHLYMNLERGENVRIKEIDIEWDWEKNDNRISKKI